MTEPGSRIPRREEPLLPAIEEERFAYLKAVIRSHTLDRIAQEKWPEGRRLNLDEAIDIVGKPIKLRDSYGTAQELLSETHLPAANGSTPPDPFSAVGTSTDIGHDLLSFLGQLYHPIYSDDFTEGGMSNLVSRAVRDRPPQAASDSFDDSQLSTLMTDEHGHVEQFNRESIVIKVIRLPRNQVQDAMKVRALREIASWHTARKLIDAKEVHEKNGVIDFIIALNEVAGVDLAQFIKEVGLTDGELPHSPQMVLKLMKAFRAMVTELHYMRKRGVLHRDIKPANLVFNAEDPDKSGVVDWGIMGTEADLELPRSNPNVNDAVLDTLPSNRLTSIGVIMGTAQYFSPAVADGDEDENIDTLALGRVFIELMGVAQNVESSRSMLTMIRIIRQGERYIMPKLTKEGYHQQLKGWSQSEIDHDFMWLINQMGQPFATSETYNKKNIEGGYEEVLHVIEDLIQRKEQEVKALGEKALVQPMISSRRRTVPASGVPQRPVRLTQGEEDFTAPPRKGAEPTVNIRKLRGSDVEDRDAPPTDKVDTGDLEEKDQE